MDHGDETSGGRSVNLDSGAQAVINGALVTANAPCRIDVSPGAYVFTGRKPGCGPDSTRSPYSELYFAILAASAEPDLADSERYRLFALLGDVVMEERTPQGQRECSRCAAAISSGRIDEAVESARRLAAAAACERHATARFGVNSYDR